jgi:hypothetical protein
VDSADDSIKRYVVYLHTYDAERRERRPVEVACFDDEAEATRYLHEAHTSVMSRRASGEADPRDHVTMALKEPGYDERNLQRRTEWKRMRRRS